MVGLLGLLLSMGASSSAKSDTASALRLLKLVNDVAEKAARTTAASRDIPYTIISFAQTIDGSIAPTTRGRIDISSRVKSLLHVSSDNAPLLNCYSRPSYPSRTLSSDDPSRHYDGPRHPTFPCTTTITTLALTKSPLPPPSLLMYLHRSSPFHPLHLHRPLLLLHLLHSKTSFQILHSLRARCEHANVHEYMFLNVFWPLTANANALSILIYLSVIFLTAFACTGCL